MNITNYSVPGLTLSGTPSLFGNTITITTSSQLAQTYTVTVSNVHRNSDNSPLINNTANFNGTPAQTPTATNTPTNTPTPQAPAVATSAATVITTSSATLNGSANPNGAATTGYFRYATFDPGMFCDDSFGTRAPASGGPMLGAGSSFVPFSQGISGLNPGTTYYVCAAAVNGGGTSFGNIVSFATAPVVPTVTTSAATSVTATTALLNGSANPDGDAATGWFRYSSTNPGTCNDTFGTRAPMSGGTALGSGNSAVPYSQGISGLTMGTTYYFCAIASNSFGTSFGSVLNFVPVAPMSPPAVTTSTPSMIASNGAFLHGSANPNGSDATGWFRYSTTNPGTCNDTFGTRAPASGGTALGSGNSALDYAEGAFSLNSGTTYYYCAIASNTYGASFGGIASFTTQGGSASIGGTVTYGNAIAAGATPTPRLVRNVTVQSTSGTPMVGPVITGTPGTYTLTGFGATAYTIKPTKPGGANTAITSADAARVAQGVSGTVPFVSQNQRFASDTSGNGGPNPVTSNDAALIAKFVAGLTGFGRTGTWFFFVTGAPSPMPTAPATYNDSRSYSSVTSNLTGEDYVAILVGEVTGNYNPANNARPSAGPEKAASVELPQITIEAGKEFVVPVRVQGAADKGITSYEFDLRYDARVIQPMPDPVDVVKTASRGLSFVTNPYEPGLLRVVMYGAYPIDENGVLLNLRFTAVGGSGTVSPLTFERIMFNEGEPSVETAAGQVLIAGHDPPD
jgi:hypothetical protein